MLVMVRVLAKRPAVTADSPTTEAPEAVCFVLPLFMVREVSGRALELAQRTHNLFFPGEYFRSQHHESSSRLGLWASARVGTPSTRLCMIWLKPYRAQARAG